MEEIKSSEKEARVDFFLVSEESFEFVHDSCVVSG